jgi:uncharacterized membrane protein
MDILKNPIARKILHGALGIVPVAIIVFVLVQAFLLMMKVLKPLGQMLHVDGYLYLILIIIGFFGAVLLLCYLLGHLFATRLGEKFSNIVEERARAMIPGYEIIARVLRNHDSDVESYQPAFVTLGAEGVEAFGFIMDDPEDSPYVTVFIPSVPVATVGSVHTVTRDRARPVDISHIEAANYITKWGVGLATLRNMTPKS